MLNNIDTILFYVKDTHKTAEFYRQLGFEIFREDDDAVFARLGSIELHFHDQTAVTFKEETPVQPRGGGVFVYVSVDDVDAYHASLLEKGMKPSSEPTDWPWGNREFAIKDPDGYKLIFYKKL